MLSRTELKSNPFPFILNKGDPLSIIQILTSIDRLGTGTGFDNLAAIISLQKRDGGFPRNLQRDQPSSVKATYRTLQTLHKAGIKKQSFIMASALDWLLKWQETDGGWHENIAVALPEWMTWESTSQSITWYTCQVGELLQQLKMQNTKVFKKIVDFLINNELSGGGWGAVAGLDGPDPDSTAGIGDFLAPILGRQNPLVRRAKSMFESALTKLLGKLKSEEIKDAYELTHLVFEAPPYLMYGKSDKRIRTLLEALIKAQRKDGGWLTFYSEGKSDVSITVFSLRTMLSHDIIGKSALQSMFDSSIITHNG